MASSKVDSERLARALQRIEAEQVRSAVPTIRSLRFRWASVAVAASVLCIALLWMQNSDPAKSAMAAVERSLQVTAIPIPRKYDLQIKFRNEAGWETHDCELYIQGRDNFALRHPGFLPETSFWVGQNEKEAWVVPAFGPVLKGGRGFLSEWLEASEEIRTSSFHVSTLLHRIRTAGYRLTIEDGLLQQAANRSIECEKIRTESSPSASNPNAREDPPDHIEVWVEKDSGLAIRLIAEWDRSEGQSGREYLELNFVVDEQDLTTDWFFAESHYEGFRTVIGSGDENK